jgi:hypothetical protein
MNWKEEAQEQKKRNNFLFVCQCVRRYAKYLHGAENA